MSEKYALKKIKLSDDVIVSAEYISETLTGDNIIKLGTLVFNDTSSDISGYQGGGSGGTNVSVEATYASGIDIGTISVDGVPKTLYLSTDSEITENGIGVPSTGAVSSYVHDKLSGLSDDIATNYVKIYNDRFYANVVSVDNFIIGTSSLYDFVRNIAETVRDS